MKIRYTNFYYSVLSTPKLFGVDMVISHCFLCFNRITAPGIDPSLSIPAEAPPPAERPLPAVVCGCHAD